MKEILKKMLPHFLILLLQKVKGYYKKQFRKFWRQVTDTYNNKIRKQKYDDRILFLPSGVLCGSFGDDIMTVSFLEMNKGKHITLYCSKVIEREYLYKYENLKLLSYNTVPMYSKYGGGIFLMGADIMTGTYGKGDIIFKCGILNNANKHNLYTSVLGFSLHDNLSSVIKETMAKLLPKTVFNLRDPDSFQVARQFLPENNLRLVADMAFLCPLEKNNDKNYLYWIDNVKKENKIVAGICPNAIQAKRMGKNNYIKQFILLLKHFYNNYNLSFALLYHDLRLENGDYSDRDLSEEIYNQLVNSIDLKDLFFTKNILNGVQLKSYLEYIDFTITGRMHFGISGYSLGKPMFGIAYEGKFSGLQKLFEIDVEKSTIDYRELANASLIADLFVDNLEKYTTSVQNNLPKVLELSKRNF